jgi:hypothetical protein
MDLARRRPDLVLELGLKMSQDLAAQVEQMEAESKVSGSRAFLLTHGWHRGRRWGAGCG